MDKLEKLEKIKQIKEDCILFRWRYLGNKIAEQFISITNLRLEIVQFKGDQVLLSQAVPVVAMRLGKPDVILQSDNITHITTGIRGGIVISGCKLRADEEGHKPKMSGSRYINEESSYDDIDTVADIIKQAPYPGIDMRMPELFRCSSNVVKMKPSWSQDLLDVIGGTEQDSTEVLFDKFMHFLSNFSVKTSIGYVIPYNFIHAGGMIIVDGTSITRNGGVVYKRSLSFFKQYVENHKWKIQLL